MCKHTNENAFNYGPDLFALQSTMGYQRFELEAK